MKMLAKIRHNEIYCAETCEGGLAAVAEEASWGTIAGCRRSNAASIRSNYSVARHSYHWLMTNHAMMKKRIVTNQNRATAFSILKGGRLQLQRTGNSVAYHGYGILQLPNHSEAVLSNVRRHDGKSWNTEQHPKSYHGQPRTERRRGIPGKNCQSV